MQIRFPDEPELWQRHVEQLISQLLVERDRLWKMSPQVPDPEAGVAFTGPLSPTAFQYGGAGAGSSGSPTSGTGPLGTGGSAS